LYVADAKTRLIAVKNTQNQTMADKTCVKFVFLGAIGSGKRSLEKRISSEARLNRDSYSDVKYTSSCNIIDSSREISIMVPRDFEDLDFGNLDLKFGNAYVILVDLTSSKQVSEAENYCNELLLDEKEGHASKPRFLIGTKLDRVADRKVSKEALAELSSKLKCVSFHELNATGDRDEILKVFVQIHDAARPIVAANEAKQKKIKKPCCIL